MSRLLCGAIGLAGLAVARGTVYLKEDFSGDWEKRWVVSDWKKDEGTAGTWSVTAGEFYGDAEADKGARSCVRAPLRRPRACRRGH
jgi:calreticulin